ncbi:MAG: 30S ribosomal protein S12 methylthiotransferase RimO [Eubacterium sp.]|nr:30S ribosomal protein S12 methylthiotransferase RimO [Eubacterium sp.]
MDIYFVSLGCDKNLVDSEKMLAILDHAGYRLAQEPEQADVIVVNTCAFIHDAKQESIETLLEMAEYKKKGTCKVLIATGCLAERYKEEIQKEMPEIDGIIGTTAYDTVAQVVDQTLTGQTMVSMKELSYIPSGLTDRIRSGAGHVGYLKIGEGCSKNCSYCAIPSMRGRYRSVPMEELIEEAVKLTASGVKELILVAQETTLYGVDLYGEKRLPELLERLAQIEAVRWIRILYCYPEEITEELAEEISKNKKVCHYLDLPIQHCNDEILKKMGRRTDKKQLMEKIEMLRKRIPNIALRTTLISGFPGETEEQHEECIEFVKAMRFDRLGVFPYSPEEGTKAAGFEGQLEKEVKRRWADEIMETQQQVIFEANENMVGRRISALVDGYLPEEDVYVARTYRDTPEIDGCVFFHSSSEILSGTMVELEVTDASGYDLIGMLCSEED